VEKKYLVPGWTMVAGLVVWVAFVVANEVGGGAIGRSPWLAVGPVLVVGGLVVFSAVRCRQIGGPRMGGFVRAGMLAVMTAVTFWRIGAVSAGVLAVATALVGMVVLTATEQQGSVQEG
jgi:hypothetical protein